MLVERNNHLGIWRKMFGKRRKKDSAHGEHNKTGKAGQYYTSSNVINYKTDRAISSVDEDLLGRAPFAENLSRAVYEYQGEDSLVIGLYGRWGTGKTSIANMALSSLEELSRNDEQKPIVVRFAPWHYSDKDNLTSRFFSALNGKIEKDGGIEFKEKIGDALSDYSDVFDLMGFAPAVVTSTLKNVAKAGGEALSKKKNLDKIKENLCEVLKKERRKIVVLIDDIDRLTNEQIRDIFQLVKQVGDLPYITYILSMDRDVVRRALAKIHDTDGDEYLEKIIQIPFVIPRLSSYKVHNIFLEKLGQAIKEFPDPIYWEENHWRDIFNNCVTPYLQTLRDVYRVINTFLFRYNMLYKETSFEDMVGITTIEVLEPVLYQWISENKEKVCGSVEHGLWRLSKKGDEIRKEYEKEFTLLKLDSEKTITSLATLFPVFAKDVNSFSDSEESELSAREKMRVAHPDRFDLYFMFDMDIVKVERNLIRDFLLSMDKVSMKKTLNEINGEGNAIYFLEEIHSLIDSIPQNRLSCVAGTLLELQYSLRGEKDRAIHTIQADYYARLCASRMVNKIETNEKRFEFFRDMLVEADRNTFGAVADELREAKKKMGDSTEKPMKEEEPILENERLKELESLFLSKVTALSASEDILLFENFMSIFLLWRSIDNAGASLFVSDVLADKIRKLRFLCRFAFKWYGTGGSGWAFNKESYSEYIDDGTEVVNTINELDMAEIHRFSETERVILATFVLYSGVAPFDHIDEKDARALATKWIQSDGAQ